MKAGTYPDKWPMRGVAAGRIREACGHRKRCGSALSRSLNIVYESRLLQF